MNLENYPHKEFTLTPNKYQIEPVKMPFTNVDEWNELYFYCKSHFMEVKPTRTGSMPVNSKCKLHSRYMVVCTKTSFELTIVCHKGCYRFILGMGKDAEKNPVSGKQAVRTIYKIAKELNIDLSKYSVDRVEGSKIKETIHFPHIEQYVPSKIVYGNVHHLDFNSSHWSRLIEKYPELKPIAEYMFNRRKLNDGYYKHVLTNSYGCMQSPFCPDVNEGGKIAPYQFANLSKIMCDGTYNIVEEYVKKLKESGRKILLTNTDGIWYQGDLYHDENEGPLLGQWKHDYTDCKMIIKSKGAYQFMTKDGKIETRIRGTTQLEQTKPREEWEFGDIFNQLAVVQIWKFDKEKGVYADVQEI